jgi:protein-disulfide isomerase
MTDEPSMPPIGSDPTDAHPAVAEASVAAAANETPAADEATTVAEPATAGEVATSVQSTAIGEPPALVDAATDLGSAGDSESAGTGPLPATEPPLPPEPAREGRSGLRVVGYLAAALGGIAIAVAALGLTGSLAIGPASSPSPQPGASSSPAPYADGRSLGDPSAPVTIDIWADFQCPYCGLQARGVEPTMERQYAAEGRARITYHDFAFLGQESLDSAVAARCAGQQGAFWYFHDLLFASQQGENQGGFARENLEGLAQFAGLDATAFSACLDDPAVLQDVQDETTAGRGVQIASTPVLCIAGPGGLQAVSGLKPMSVISAAIEQVEQAVPSGSPTGSPSSSPSPSPSPSPSGASASPAAELCVALAATPSGSPSSSAAPSASAGASPAASASPTP